MSSDVLFSSNNDSIIDEWLNGVSLDQNTKQQLAVIDSTSSQGLGFKKPRVEAKNTDNALVKRLKRDVKQKSVKVENSLCESHGIIENEEVSRTSLHTLVDNRSSNKSKVSEIKPIIGMKTAAVEETLKRKRPKTRSKQKNIRRDRRAIEHKPEHLQIGSKHYTGRPLTEVKNIDLILFYFIVYTDH